MKILNINAREYNYLGQEEYNEVLINIHYIIAISATFQGEDYLGTEISVAYGGTVKIYFVRETPREVAEMMGYPIQDP